MKFQEIWNETKIHQLICCLLHMPQTQIWKVFDYPGVDTHVSYLTFRGSVLLQLHLIQRLIV